MDDDLNVSAALAVLSDRSPSLFTYFKQRFAQVTNPAIDSVREQVVMSLRTDIGPQGNLLSEEPQIVNHVELSQPILTDFELERGGHAVHCFEAIVFFVLTMLVQIDKTRRDNQTTSIDHSTTAKIAAADRFDSAVGDSEIADRIGTRFRIDHSAVEDDEIQRCLRPRECWNQKRAED